MEDPMNAYTILILKHLRLLLHGKLRRRWEDNIRIDLWEID
jgi:hypothetical protein